MWIEGTDGQGPKTQTRPMVLLLLEDRATLRTLCILLHISWTGTRFGLIAFTSSQVGNMNNDTRQQLDNLNFRLPTTAAVAAPARHLPRPIACTVGGGSEA